MCRLVREIKGIYLEEGKETSCDVSFRHGGGEDSQTERTKIGTAAPYFPKVPFEASHLPIGNTNIISHFRRIGDFSLLSAFKRNFLYFVLEIGTIVSKIILGVLKVGYRTVISSSQRVVGRLESFDLFICHDLSPMPSAAENTFPLP